MIETLSAMPPSFWVVIAILAIGTIWSTRHVRDGSGLPVLAVLGTVTAWYVGDAFYNDYTGYYLQTFDANVLRDAWWEVAWFLTVFLLVTPLVHRWVNARYIRKGSGALKFFKYGVDQPVFQRQLNLLFFGCLAIWLALMAVAAVRVQGQILPFLFPFLGGNVQAWGRARVGSGFDAVWSMAFFFQLLVTSIFGVVAALATNRRVRRLAIACCLFSMPYFIFQRTRNTMLAAIVPGVLSWVFLRLRGSMIKKITVLGGCFLLINAWMGFVIANRQTVGITKALKEKKLSLVRDSEVHHEGLTMFEELCWMNSLMQNGAFSPDWGYRYYAELMNPIPRSLWPGKPLIDIAYSIARGQGGGEASQAGVYATMSTGLVGQGVENFGRLFGPAAAAIIMSFWVAILARLDLRIDELGRLPLYFCGLILTFNLGRDITLLTLWPFVFGYITILWMERSHRSRVRPALHATKPGRQAPGFSSRRVPSRRWGPRGNITRVPIMRGNHKQVAPGEHRRA